MIFQFDSWVFWLIVMVGVFTYAMIFDLMLNRCSYICSSLFSSRIFLIKGFLAALPLLGLLGTIMGLLETFSVMAHDSMNYEAMIAGGVGMALGTTQLGLLLSVPGLLMCHYASTYVESIEVTDMHPIVCD